MSKVINLLYNVSKNNYLGIKYIFHWGGIPSLVVMGGDSLSKKVVGSNPGTIYWIDIFHIYFVVKIVMMFV